MGSMQHQQFLLQRQVAPNTPLITAMRSYQALKMMPGHDPGGGQSYTASGYRGATAHVRGDEFGKHSIEAAPCFNGVTPVLASILGLPVTTTPDATNAPLAREHVFTLLGRGDRSPVLFTSQWGDSAHAMQMVDFVFNTLNLGVQRGELTFDTSAISKTPDETITLATAGVTDILAVPWDPTQYDVWADDTYAAIGTTKLLDCHEGAVSVGDTWGRSSPINSAIVSFSKLLENMDVDYAGQMVLAFDAVAKALMATFKNGARKFIRLAQNGPIIGGAIRYRLAIDFGIIITERGEYGTAPNSPEVALPFTYKLSPDAVSNTLIKVTLINTVSSV